MMLRRHHQADEPEPDPEHDEHQADEPDTDPDPEPAEDAPPPTKAAGRSAARSKGE